MYGKKRFAIPDILAKMYAVFSGAGFKAYLVGGAVRDTFLGKSVSDFDIATNAAPQDVMKLFRRVIPTGIAHGTVTVLFMGRRVEVTTFRTEGGYTDGRHPDKVSFDTTIEADLSRRDFTMNAVAVNLEDGGIIDPYGGRSDIACKLIRTVGSPWARFTEDALRPIRAIRFSACLGFTIDELTLEAIPLSVQHIKYISVERFRDEFIKILGADEPSQAFSLLEDCGILNIFIPELVRCRDVSQADGRGNHRFDVLDHLYYSCDGAPKDSMVVRLAALFHDIAKPAAKQIAHDGTAMFYNHEKLGAELTEEILSRLRFPYRTTQAVSHLIACHMFYYESVWTDAAVRRFIARATPGAIEDLFALRLADVHGMTRSPPAIGNNPWCGNLIEFKERIKKELAHGTALTLKDLAVNGNDLMAEGIPGGKILGEILRALFDTALDDPQENERAHLIELAKNMYARIMRVS